MVNYRIFLRKEPEGGFTVNVPSLPGCITYGENLDEAIDMAKEAIELYIESLRAHHEEVPTEEGVILKRETASLRGIWKGDLTEKDIDEGIKEIRSKWRIDTQ